MRKARELRLAEERAAAEAAAHLAKYGPPKPVYTGKVIVYPLSAKIMESYLDIMKGDPYCKIKYGTQTVKTG